MADPCGNFLVAPEAWAGRRTATKAALTPGWLTSSAIKPVTYLLAVLMWGTVAKVGLISYSQTGCGFRLTPVGDMPEDGPVT